MGSSASREAPSVIDSFPEIEKSKLQKLFQDLCFLSAKSDHDAADANRPKSYFTQTALEELIQENMSKFLTHHLFNVMKVQSKHKGTLNYCDDHGFVSTLYQITKGTNSEKHKILFLMASLGEEMVSSTHLFKIVQELVTNYIQLARKSSNLQSWIASGKEENVNNFCQYLLRDLYHPGIKPKELKNAELPCKEYEFYDVEAWLLKCPAVIVILNSVVSSCFPYKTSSEMEQTEIQNNGILIPECISLKGSLKDSLLDVPTIFMLNNQLPSSLRKEWTLLFTSAKDGQSFATFVQHIRNEGPSLVIVRDKAGHVFGGFASISWEFNANFTGNDDCFLFTSYPTMGVYKTTGYNDHYMYINLKQQTLPNGLGMGGQLSYFGLWIDSDYGIGKCSSTCTTYESPMLSSTENFEIDVLEVWRAGPKPKRSEEEEEMDDRPSILDKNPEAKAMLMLINKATHSDGLRDRDPTVDIPEEKELFT